MRMPPPRQVCASRLNLILLSRLSAVPEHSCWLAGVRSGALYSRSSNPCLHILLDINNLAINNSLASVKDA